MTPEVEQALNALRERIKHDSDNAGSAPALATLAAALGELDALRAPFACWHCGDVLEPETPRCERCPAECDDEGCAMDGCQAAHAAGHVARPEPAPPAHCGQVVGPMGSSGRCALSLGHSGNCSTRSREQAPVPPTPPDSPLPRYQHKPVVIGPDRTESDSPRAIVVGSVWGAAIRECKDLTITKLRAELADARRLGEAERAVLESAKSAASTAWERSCAGDSRRILSDEEVELIGAVDALLALGEQELNG